MLRRVIGNIVSVMYSLPRLLIRRVFNNGVSFRFIERISPNVIIEIDKFSKLEIGNKVRIHSNSKIKVRKYARLCFGDNVRINYGCMIVCHKEIEIKAGVEFGPNVLVYDHDHDFRHQDGIKANKFKSAPIVIGENTWIGASSIILKGVNIGKNCVIGAGSVVADNIPDNTLFIQERKNLVKKISM